MKPGSIVQRILALVAVLLGVVTVLAGARVLLGADPGYVVYRPLLVYNTGMGLAYVGAGVAAWRSLAVGRRAAAAIFALNVLVLGAIGARFAIGGDVAVQSVLAMTLRTLAWLALLLAFAWLGRRHTALK